MTTTNITPTMTTGAAVRALCTLCALLLHRAATATAVATVTATTTAATLARRAWVWLTTTHDFGDEEDPIRMTGWQYLGFGFGVMACTLFLCLDFDALWA
jgi:hypothetical protein